MGQLLTGGIADTGCLHLDAGERRGKSAWQCRVVSRAAKSVRAKVARFRAASDSPGVPYPTKRPCPNTSKFLSFPCVAPSFSRAPRCLWP
jgi:hypothetical protein